MWGEPALEPRFELPDLEDEPRFRERAVQAREVLRDGVAEAVEDAEHARVLARAPRAPVIRGETERLEERVHRGGARLVQADREDLARLPQTEPVQLVADP